MDTQRISIVGSGNVATHLAVSLHKAGHQIVQIISRRQQNAQQLASVVGAAALDDVSLTTPEVDIIIVSVSDQAIPQTATQLPNTSALVVHTAGSVAMDVFSRFVNYGVLYPFQTFSKQKAVDMGKVPFLLEANSEENLSRLKSLAQSLSPLTLVANSEQRTQLHIAAVLACNFVNHLYTLSHKLLDQSQLPFELLFPLIDETTQKIKNMPPLQAQTGPAVRGDSEVLKKHLAMLAGDANVQAIYELMSRSIGETHNQSDRHA